MLSEPAIGNESTFLYRLLVSPKLRWARYLILIGILVTISFNQVFIFYVDFHELLGEWMYVFTVFYLFTYLSVVYINLHWLLPHYLLKRKYLTYVLLLSATMAGALLMQMVMEYTTYSFWPQMYIRGDYFSIPMLMDYISSFILTILCMIGGAITVLLKVWMINYQRVSQLEKAHILSEVEQLKEQVSPELLFRTLHYSGSLTLTEPERASKIVMKLSQLLRYQLYDCNRAKVLLSSEITFLTNYLILEQYHLSRFNYSLTSEGEVSHTLIPPLLFIPFVQLAVRKMYELQVSEPTFLNIHLRVEENLVQFDCSCPEFNFVAENGLERIKQRLSLLYGAHYDLLQTDEGISLLLKGGTL